MKNLRSDLPPLPQRMRKLHVDERGYPVPFFVAWVDGKPDFRAIDPVALSQSVKFDRCWLCGEPLGRVRCFLIGPMCSVNRTTAEPPSHSACAAFAARACPFLTRPMAKRNERNLPEGAIDAPGIPLARNPGVTAQWFVERTNSAPRGFEKGYKPFSAGGGRTLYRIGEPTQVDWWREGRAATRAEAMESIESGLPSLQELCESEGERAMLEKSLATAMKFLPAASAA